MVPFDRLHTPSYSTSKATIRLSLAVSEIWRDEKMWIELTRCVASVQKETTANQCSQNAYITQPALFSKHNRIRASDQTNVELLHSLQFTAPCGGSDASRKMPDRRIE